MTAPDFREALARTLCESVNPGGHGWNEHRADWFRDADAVLALLAERLGGDEVRGAVMRAVDDYEQGLDSLDDTTQFGYAAAALAAIRGHLGVQR